MQESSQPASIETDNTESVIHQIFGDLSSPEAVVINGRDKLLYSYSESNPLFIHLSVTGRCYARCQGCINTAFKASSSDERIDRGPFKDTNPARDARCIVNLVKDTDKDIATVCFYGGEPLLAVDKINQVMENIGNTLVDKEFRYMLYTNGDLLDQASQSYPELMKNIWLFSVSIDGTLEQHERIRPGTSLQKIHTGLAALKKIRTGQVLMWSTLREDQSLIDCFNEFSSLHEKGFVDQFFWHWVESSEPFHVLPGYLAAYEKDLTSILGSYLHSLKNGRILPIVHINELVLYLLTGKKRNSTACGVELAGNYDILDGRIHSCADLPIEHAIGTIDDQGSPHIISQDLTWLTDYKKDIGCYACGVHSYCGGRCPIQAVTGSMARLRQYCQLMRLHVGVVISYMDDIEAAMASQNISPQMLYDRSAFYVQFTDGTP